MVLSKIASDAAGVATTIRMDKNAVCQSNGSPERSCNLMELNGIKMKFGTVHSVKGMTVDALLLLTCQYYSLTANMSPVDGTELDYLVKGSSKRSIEKRQQIYVAMSRPRHLFAWAVPDSKRDLLPAGLMSNFVIVK